MGQKYCVGMVNVIIWTVAVADFELAEVINYQKLYNSLFKR